jgi:hypothetical protein
MTDTTPPEGHQNHNPDAPTEHIDAERIHAERLETERLDAERIQAEHHRTEDRADENRAEGNHVDGHTSETASPEPTTVADPITVDPTADVPMRETVEPVDEPVVDYVPGEPVDYDTVSSRETPTEKVERLTVRAPGAEPTSSQDTLEENARTERIQAAPTDAGPAHSGSTSAETARDEAAAQKKDYTPNYVPAAAAVPASSAAVAQPATQQSTQQFAPTPIYVTAPTPPKKQGNRAAGILIGLIATVVFAAIYALVAFAISAAGAANLGDATARFTDFLVLPVFYVPVIFFFLAFALLVAVLNRAGWWAYVLGGFLVAVVVYFAYIGGALLAVQAWTLTSTEAARFISTQWLNPGAIAAAVVAREVPIWFGAWIARRGRTVTAKNAAARTEYERQLAEGPQLARPS